MHFRRWAFEEKNKEPAHVNKKQFGQSLLVQPRCTLLQQAQTSSISKAVPELIDIWRGLD